MVRRSSLIIGLGLALLSGIGLSLDHRATMLWFDAVAAVVAFAIAGLAADSAEHNPGNAVGPAMLGLGLAALWIVGIASRQPAWAAWANLPFAVACLAIAVVAASGREVTVSRHARVRV